MNRNAILANVMVLAAVLTGCESTGNPVAPQESQAVFQPRLTILSQTLSGYDQLDLTFDAVAPTGTAISDGTSLSVLVTDLLGIPLGLDVASTGSTATPGDPVDGEDMAFNGSMKTKTQKVNYSDGTSQWSTDITTGAFQGTGKQSGGQCKTHDNFTFHGDNPGGATTFTQQVRFATICQGSGRTMWLHILVHFTVTPNGKVASNVDKVWISND